MKLESSSRLSRDAGATQFCALCGKPPATVRLPFAVGKQESPPLPQRYRILVFGPLKKKFVQRYRWIWHTLWLCKDCSGKDPSDALWAAVQSHPGTRLLVAQGYTETRLDPHYPGQEGDVTFSQEPI
ncbi:MAG TPA: hypothetical protein VGR67_13800 [Candidatus Polarisedimenticolia bacterium]|jgi:hypothetical protein|nr:hypothetical protein [Candidatus Polarisedimenticolia bacterium]